MNTKHTPGPWGIRKSESGALAIFNAAGIWIATTLRKAWPSEDMANARLMATAPEMLEALDNIGGLSRALRVGGPDPMDLHGLSDALQEAVDMANAIVAKATGASHVSQQ